MQQLEKKELKVLLCEDDIVSSLALTKRLEDRGIEIVAQMQQTVEIFEQISKLNFDLVILDVWLTDEKKGGVLAAQHIRETSEVPIIFQTGYSDREILEELLSFTNTQVIKKPYEIEELLALVQKMPF